jgi:hypothetical protein
VLLGRDARRQQLRRVRITREPKEHLDERARTFIRELAVEPLAHVVPVQRAPVQRDATADAHELELSRGAEQLRARERPRTRRQRVQAISVQHVVAGVACALTARRHAELGEHLHRAPGPVQRVRADVQCVASLNARACPTTELAPPFQQSHLLVLPG